MTHGTFDRRGAASAGSAVLGAIVERFIRVTGEVTEEFIGVNLRRLGKRAVSHLKDAKMWPAPQRTGHMT